MTKKLTIDGIETSLDALALMPFRKLPVVIWAVQINEPFGVETLEGTMRGDAGDYLIRGVKGELYPCKPDIFLATYEYAALPAPTSSCCDKEVTA